jgi:hypothetical protein
VGREDDVVNERTSRPLSPVKMLSNLFSGGSMKDPSSPKKSRSVVLGDGPRLMPPPPIPNSRPQSRDNDLTRPPSSGIDTVGFNSATSTVDPLIKLEETMATYVLALHSRKGNVVGRSILGRANADLLAVNELYNSLLEDPMNYQAAAQAPVDVLFAAFEQFVHMAWKDTIGPVVTQTILTAIQAKSDANIYPGDFEEAFRRIVSEMAPQNQRAFQACVKLLADLLDGTSNDSDRGILTVAFAELLIKDGKAQDFIGLLDRFVEDVDALFGRPPSSGLHTPTHGSITSESRSRTATGSITSNTSSLRKRFGLTLSRENSKSELESKFGSVLRTLSKNRSGGDSQPSSISKSGSLSRSKSTDTDVRLSPKRPSSRDRPTVLGAFSFEQDSPGGLSHSGFKYLSNPILDTIGETRENLTSPRPKKKRRSSLSDLRSLRFQHEEDQGRQINTGLNPQTPERVGIPRPGHKRQTSASPMTPTSISKLANIPPPLTPSRLPSPSKKENAPILSPITRKPIPAIKPSALAEEQSEATTTSNTSPRKRRSDSASGIPKATPSSMRGAPAPLIPSTIKERPGGLRERPTSGNKLPSESQKPSSPTKKLRMQSPQKLRERLQKEEKAISTASASLQAELRKIGDELSSIPSLGPSLPQTPARRRAQSTYGSPSKSLGRAAGTAVASSATSLDNSAFTAKITTLETTLTTAVSDLEAQLKSLQVAVAESLTVSEQRARSLDQLYREANAENEALYAKFNEELGRVSRAVKADNTAGNTESSKGVEELKRQLRERGEEMAVLKRENARLKREVGGLRAQLRE